MKRKELTAKFTGLVDLAKKQSVKPLFAPQKVSPVILSGGTASKHQAKKVKLQLPV